MLRRFVILFFLFGAMLQTVAQTAKVSGFWPGDSTKALRLAMDSDNDTLIIDNTGRTWILEPLRFAGVHNKVIILEEGVELRAKKWAFGHRGACLLKFIDCENIQIIGRGNNVLSMNKSEYQEGEFRHVILLRGSRDIRISNLTLKDSGGDGIIFTKSKKNPYCSQIEIDRVKSYGNKRQGMTIVSAKNVLVTNSEFANTEGTLPGAGVDLEPDLPSDFMENIVFRGCIFRNNYHAGIKVALDKLTSASHSISVVFEDCLLQNNFSPENPIPTPAEIFVVANKLDPVLGFVKFKECLIENSHWPLLFARNNASGYDVSFVGGMARNVARSKPSTIYLRNVKDSPIGQQGRLYFQDFYIRETRSSQIFHLEGNASNNMGQLKKIHGSIYITPAEGVPCSDIESGIKSPDTSMQFRLYCGE